MNEVPLRKRGVAGVLAFAFFTARWMALIFFLPSFHLMLVQIEFGSGQACLVIEVLGSPFRHQVALELPDIGLALVVCSLVAQTDFANFIVGP